VYMKKKTELSELMSLFAFVATQRGSSSHFERSFQ
jgi:hypothetical protein